MVRISHLYPNAATAEQHTASVDCTCHPAVEEPAPGILEVEHQEVPAQRREESDG